MVNFHVDPLNKFPHASQNELIYSCGFLTGWIMQADSTETIKEALLRNYAYFMGEMKGGTLSNDGVFSYPEDEDLYPVALFELDGEKCFIFPHAIVGIINKDGSTWMTRMD
jgi:hypothetical protein